MQITHDTPIYIGKHKGTPMKDVPASWKLWFYENGNGHNDIKYYIMENLEEIEKQAGRNAFNRPKT